MKFRPQAQQFFRGKQSLQFLEQNTLFLANMLGQHRGKNLQIGHPELAAAGIRDIAANQCVFDSQFVDELLQLGKAIGRRENKLLFRSKMKRELLAEELNDFRFPMVNVRGVMHLGEGFSDAHAKGERVLMLVRERDQAKIAKHPAIMPVGSSSRLPLPGVPNQNEINRHGSADDNQKAGDDNDLKSGVRFCGVAALESFDQSRVVPA